MLIDTSVWIEFLRAKGDPIMKSQVSQLMVQECGAYTCPVSFELNLGAKPHELKDLQTGLSLALRIKATPDDWDTAAKAAAMLRQKGRNFPALDLLIAAVACREKVLLVSKDGHFVMIRDHAMPALQLM